MRSYRSKGAGRLPICLRVEMDMDVAASTLKPPPPSLRHAMPCLHPSILRRASARARTDACARPQCVRTKADPRGSDRIGSVGTAGAVRLGRAHPAGACRRPRTCARARAQSRALIDRWIASWLRLYEPSAMGCAAALQPAAAYTKWRQ